MDVWGGWLEVVGSRWWRWFLSSILERRVVGLWAEWVGFHTCQCIALQSYGDGGCAAYIDWLHEREGRWTRFIRVVLVAKTVYAVGES